MRACNTKHIHFAIKEALKSIPVVWPLKQWIATNPLWDQIEHTIEDATRMLSVKQHARPTLPLDHYINLYNAMKIHDKDIDASIQSFIESQKQSFNHTKRINPTDPIQKLIFSFMTSYSVQALSYELSQSRNQNHPPHDALMVESIQTQCLDWLSCYFNPNKRHQQFIESLECTEKGQHTFYAFCHHVLSSQNTEHKKCLEPFLPNQALEQIIANLLSFLSVDQNQIDQTIFAIAWQLKGWMGIVKWQERYPYNPYVRSKVSPAELILSWLIQEACWYHAHGMPTKCIWGNTSDARESNHDVMIKMKWRDHIDEAIECGKLLDQSLQIHFLKNQCIIDYHDLQWLWQRAHEISYQRPLIQSLRSCDSSICQDKPYKAQWVFCIDVRSEGYRRHLEATGPYETFGFAGFFGIAYELIDPNQGKHSFQCPALIEPSLRIEMIQATQSLYQDAIAMFVHSVDQNRKSTLTSFALYEMLGPYFMPLIALKNMAIQPLAWVQRRCLKYTKQSEKSSVSYQIEHINIERMCEVAKNFLTGVGLRNHFSPIVVICGHHASTSNNPYQAALDCGACGGNSGSSNAIIICDILNKPEVRKALQTHGIRIPEKTHFIAAVHNTTTDTIDWHGPKQSVDSGIDAMLKEIQQDAIKASHALRQERMKRLPGPHTPWNRSRHWAELVPEWGLANNAAIIIGPRKLSQSFDLNQRVFLHSYNHEDDQDGSVLESIMLGPMIVAHWINSQYYFSTVEPKHFGAGNKAIHNILPMVGVMEGNQSDLKYGLPLQSISYQNRLMHDPMRLCVIIDAPQSQINAIISKHEQLEKLVIGRWLWVESLREIS